MSVRLKLTLSYAGILMFAGLLVFAVIWVLLLRYGPTGMAADRSIRGNSILAIRLLFGAFAPAAATVLAFLLVFGLLGGWVLAGRMLAPLTRIRDATRLAADGSLAHRIRMPGPKDEFRELADAFDTMLARLEAQVAEHQRFAANASHELRTPLAITQSLLDVARKDPHHDNAELVERLGHVNVRAIDLTEALLLLSRVDRESLNREVVDLSLIAEESGETLLPLAERRGVTLDVAGETAPTFGSEALLLQLTTNLVQNAIVHNLPVDGRVAVRTERQQQTTVLSVENTGPVVAADLVPTLTEPFQRGAGRLHDPDDQAGVGLGLAIVQSITRAHDGILTITPRSEGGLLVVVRLPIASPISTRGSRAG